jgi:hypothetical protein
MPYPLLFTHPVHSQQSLSSLFTIAQNLISGATIRAVIAQRWVQYLRWCLDRNSTGQAVQVRNFMASHSNTGRSVLYIGVCW